MLDSFIAMAFTFYRVPKEAQAVLRLKSLVRLKVVDRLSQNNSIWPC